MSSCLRRRRAAEADSISRRGVAPGLQDRARGRAPPKKRKQKRKNVRVSTLRLTQTGLGTACCEHAGVDALQLGNTEAPWQHVPGARLVLRGRERHGFDSRGVSECCKRSAFARPFTVIEGWFPLSFPPSPTLFDRFFACSLSARENRESEKGKKKRESGKG